MIVFVTITLMLMQPELTVLLMIVTLVFLFISNLISRRITRYTNSLAVSEFEFLSTMLENIHLSSTISGLGLWARREEIQGDKEVECQKDVKRVKRRMANYTRSLSTITDGANLILLMLGVLILWNDWQVWPFVCLVKPPLHRSMQHCSAF